MKELASPGAKGHGGLGVEWSSSATTDMVCRRAVPLPLKNWFSFFYLLISTFLYFTFQYVRNSFVNTGFLAKPFCENRFYRIPDYVTSHVTFLTCGLRRNITFL